jgi:hypothetical protein
MSKVFTVNYFEMMISTRNDTKPEQGRERLRKKFFLNQKSERAKQPAFGKPRLGAYVLFVPNFS